jgi:hypothetical protein
MRFVLSLVLVGGALGGCAGTGTTPPADEPGGPSVTSSAGQPSPSASEGLPTPTPSGAVPTDPAQPAPPVPTGGSTDKPSAPMTLTGTVQAGVEPNCVLLDGYLLLGGPREQLRSGSRVTVTGRVQKDVMTTCQQGTPFMVETAKPA